MSVPALSEPPARLAEALSALPPTELEKTIDAAVSKPLSDGELVTLVAAVLSTDLAKQDFGKVVDILEAEAVTTAQVSAAVNEIVAQGVSSEQAVLLVTSEKVLESVTGEQAAAVFEAVDESALTEELGAQIVDAVQEAADEVRGAFEQAINVFGGAVDSYVALGSNVTVGERRTLIATTAVTSTLATAAATAGAAGAGGGSGPSGSSGSSSGTNDAARREDEDGGDEPAGEIAGESDGTKIRFIYRDQENKMRVDWRAFLKKLWKETAALSFTLAGSVVVFVTLSGVTQLVALVATGVALLVHYVNVMSDQGDE